MTAAAHLPEPAPDAAPDAAPHAAPGPEQDDVGQPALAPVRRWLRDDARARAAGQLAAARREAQAVLDDARRRADELVDAARSEGAARAADAAARELARARREARGTVLRARADREAGLATAVTAAACALREEPGYPQLVRRLTDRARAVLGKDAQIREAPGGGIIAWLGSRSLDLSLPALAAGVLDEDEP